MILLDKKYLVVEHDPELNCLIHHWKGFATSVQFREGLSIGHKMFVDMKVANIIIDAEESGVVKHEDTAFAASLFPMLIENGLRKFAFVVSEKNIFSKISTETFSKKAPTLSHIRYFTSLQEAKDWIAASE